MNVALNPAHSHENRNVVIAALGIVFGDIGTSPLYTMKECFSGAYPVAPSAENILGILSLILWSLIIVVSLKYVTFIMRMDNKGEGGILALLSLVQQRAGLSAKRRSRMVILGLVGASLFYGDGIITPAISVLSAVEGIEVLKSDLHDYVIPITLGVLLLLFGIQSKGTSLVGSLFGPVMLLWFCTLAYTGIHMIEKNPEVLNAVNPVHAWYFFKLNGHHALLALGGVVLAITGGEALYADMGHFGRAPIQKSWFLIVLPALLLNYFGQGALLMQNPEAARNPFYLMLSPASIPPMIVLATMATIIASQAVISGAFSLTMQAIQLGYLPRLAIKHTSAEEIGQIYLPWINWALFVGIVCLVLGFQSSSELAAAYGIAVTGTMMMTTILAYVVVSKVWCWGTRTSLMIAAFFLVIDVGFFSANAVKFIEGGWFPVLIGSFVLILLTTWKRGRDLVLEKQEEISPTVEEFLREIEVHDPVRVNGTAVFLTPHRKGVPPALMQNLEHNKVLHDKVVLMTVVTENIPRVSPEKRREVRQLSSFMFRVVLHYGFMEQPDIPRALKSCSRGFDTDPRTTIFFLWRETIIPSSPSKMVLWRLRLFTNMARNTGSAAIYFRIPPEKVVELGTQMMI